MYTFLLNHRDELIAWFKQKVGERPNRSESSQQLAYGIPLVMDQHTGTEGVAEAAERFLISGPTGEDPLALCGTRVRNGVSVEREGLALASLIADAQTTGELGASLAGRAIAVSSVDPTLVVVANRDLLLAALANLLQKALQFTRANTAVTLNTYASGERALIEVTAHYSGLPPGSAEKLFAPLSQRSHDQSRLRFELSAAHHSVEAVTGTLTARDVPGIGCVFTISLPRDRASYAQP